MMKQCALLLSLLFIFTSCNRQKNEGKAASEKSGDTILNSTTEPLLLSDSLFALRNIENTLVANNFEFKNDGQVWYEKDDRKLLLVKLTDEQQLRLVARCPGLASPGMTRWIMEDWEVRFVSKQNQIRSLTPIIVTVGGTDFSGLYLILLDKQNEPISCFLLRGGECGEDFCGIRESFFNGEQINTYNVNVASYPSPGMATLDSVTYVSTILPNGRFETERADSTRYTRELSED